MPVLRFPARFPLTALFSAALGVLNTLAFFNDNAWPLQIAVLAALFALVMRTPSAARGARAGFAFGLGWFLCGISWLFISMHTYGLLPAWFAALCTFGFCCYLSLYPALAMSLFAALLQRGMPAGRALLLAPLLFTLSELLRSVVLTGFPWLATGYAEVGGPLAGFAPIAGVFGVTLASAGCAASVTALGMRRTQSRLRPVALACLVALIAGGFACSHIDFTHASGATVRVRLLQGNVAQAMKFDRAELQRTIALYFGLIERAPADLIVLPETALPIFFNDIDSNVIERLHHDAVTLDASIAVGVPIADGPTRYTNSVVVFSKTETRLSRYDKSHLVPFGEFVPRGFHWFVHMMQIPLGDFTAGEPDQPPVALSSQAIGFDICYEDLFGAQIARQARNSTMLVNLSNVAWFGDSLALPEHLQIARMRAIETGRPMLRATNTGMTAAIDARGQVIGVLAPFTAGELTIDIQPMAGETPYSQLLDWPLWILCAMGAVLSFAFLVRANRARRLS